jgi:hypothetical protein
VTEQDSLTSNDVDDVIVNEENVTTNVTHESHVHDGDDTDRHWCSRPNSSWSRAPQGVVEGKAITIPILSHYAYVTGI